MQQLIVDPPYPVEYLSQIVRVHERHWDDDVLRVIPSNLPDRRDRKSPPQGEILIVSARCDFVPLGIYFLGGEEQ